MGPPRRAVSRTATELDRLLTEVAETHPGIVAKLRLIWGDIEADSPPPHAQLSLAEVFRVLAACLEAQAGPPIQHPGADDEMEMP